MSEHGSAGFGALISRNLARDAFTTALRLYVGRRRRYSVKQLAIGTGIPARMIEAFIASPDTDEYRQPALEAIYSLTMFLGGEFAAEWLAPTGVGAFDLPAPEDPDRKRRPDPKDIAAQAVQDAAEMNKLASEGGTVVDMRDLGTRMMVRGANVRARALHTQPDLLDWRRRA